MEARSADEGRRPRAEDCNLLGKLPAGQTLVFPTSISDTKPPVPSLLEGQEQMTIEGLGVKDEGETKCSRPPGRHTMVIADSHL